MLIPDLRVLIFHYAFGEGSSLYRYEQDVNLCAAAQEAIPPMFLEALVPRRSLTNRQNILTRAYNPYRRGLPYTPTWSLVMEKPYVWSFLPTHIAHRVDAGVAFKIRTYKRVTERWTRQLESNGVHGWNDYYNKFLKRLRPGLWVRTDFMAFFFEELATAHPLMLWT